MPIATGVATDAIAAHAYTGPTPAAAVVALGRAVGVERAGALWQGACETAGLHAPERMSGDEMQRVAAALAAHGGPVASAARALQIRLRTYARLAAR